MYTYDTSFFAEQPRPQPPKAAATTLPATPQWLPMTNLDGVSFYGSPSPALNACANRQWVCYGDYVLLKVPNYANNGNWYGPWWTVHSCNFMAQLNIGLYGNNGASTNPSYYAAWNSYGVFVTPYYYQQNTEGYDHLRTSVGIFQLVPYGAKSPYCAPGTSPMCTSQELWGQPVCYGDTVYLQWNMLCTHNNPTYCEVPYCWGNIAGNTARLAWYTNSEYTNITEWPLYVSQNYTVSGTTNTASGNSCVVYDLPQLTNITSTGGTSPDNQVYMQNSSWTNDKYTLFVVGGGSSGDNVSYGDSLSFAPYDNSGYSVTLQPLEVENNDGGYNWNKILPRQFSEQLCISKGTATSFQIMPATNPLVTTQPTQQLYCFDTPGKCTGNKPTCEHGQAGCVAGQWQCLNGIYTGCSCPLSKCNATGYCLTPANTLPTKTVVNGQCVFTCNKGINPYLYFLIPCIVLIIFFFLFFII